MTTAQALDFGTIQLLFWATVSFIVAAHIGAVREAWPQAVANNPKKNWRFFLSLAVREQLHYARRIPMLIFMVIASVIIAVI